MAITLNELQTYKLIYLLDKLKKFIMIMMTTNNHNGNIISASPPEMFMELNFEIKILFPSGMVIVNGELERM